MYSRLGAFESCKLHIMMPKCDASGKQADLEIAKILLPQLHLLLRTRDDAAAKLGSDPLVRLLGPLVGRHVEEELVGLLVLPKDRLDLLPTCPCLLVAPLRLHRIMTVKNITMHQKKF